MIDGFPKMRVTTVSENIQQTVYKMALCRVCPALVKFCRALGNIRRLSAQTSKPFFTVMLFILSQNPLKAENSILVQSTTSTANSGLYDYLLPLFEQTHEVNVKVVAVGTGQAIKNARNCDADVLLVHARDDEQRFVDDGYGVERFDLMYNDFVFVGPGSDPAEISSAGNLKTALQRIAASNVLFASRGDDSGTHKKELSLWMSVAIEPEEKWYRSTGSGMGATLNTGIGLGAYVMTDRATWISFGNKADYKVLFEGDDALFNQYGIVQVNSNICPTVNANGAEAFLQWMLSSTGQKAIAAYAMDGQQLFFPNASPLEN